MEKLCASEAPWWRFAAIGLVTAGLSLPAAARAASPEDRAPGPGLGCVTPEGASTMARPYQVRADRAKRAAPPHRDQAPAAEQAMVEPPAVLMRAFYTCVIPGRAPVSQRGGWLSVGPLRRT
jgi:hypothetical protein